MHCQKALSLVALAANLASSTPSLPQPRAASCQYQVHDQPFTFHYRVLTNRKQSGNGTCISTSSCAGTNVAGFCPGGNDIQCCVRTCSWDEKPGFCQSTSNTCSGGAYNPEAHCPGADNIQCCLATCSTQSGDGVCQWTGSPCQGKYLSGACPGPSDVECCVGGSTTGPPSPGTGVPGVDISDLAPDSFWGCAASKWQVVVIQGYIQGCSVV